MKKITALAHSRVGDLQIEITASAPKLAELAQAVARYAKRAQVDRQTLYSVAATAFAFGLPQPPKRYDPQIVKLAQQTIYSYDDLERWLVWIAASLDKSVEYCLTFVANDIDRLEQLAYCAYAIKHWNAPNRAPLDALASIPDDTV